MFTAKALVKAAIADARAYVEKMSDEAVMYDHTAMAHERPFCIFTRRAIDRRARELFRAMEIEATEPEPVESLENSPEPDWLTFLYADE